MSLVNWKSIFAPAKFVASSWRALIPVLMYLLVAVPGTYHITCFYFRQSTVRSEAIRNWYRFQTCDPEKNIILYANTQGHSSPGISAYILPVFSVFWTLFTISLYLYAELLSQGEWYCDILCILFWSFLKYFCFSLILL